MSEPVSYAEFRSEPATLDDDQRVLIAAKHAREFLRALGVATDSVSMRRSPLRMARAYAELLTPTEFDATTFPNDEDYRELVLVRDIPVRSICEHHLLPFAGVAHIGYLPSDRLLGLSKFARIVDMLARRPQVQERLTRQVTEWLDGELEPHGVGVVIEAEHSCMTIRGVRAAGAVTRTLSTTGLLRSDPVTRAEFLSAVGPERGVR